MKEYSLQIAPLGYNSKYIIFYKSATIIINNFYLIISFFTIDALYLFIWNSDLFIFVWKNTAVKEIIDELKGFADAATVKASELQKEAESVLRKHAEDLRQAMDMEEVLDLNQICSDV